MIHERNKLKTGLGVRRGKAGTDSAREETRLGAGLFVVGGLNNDHVREFQLHVENRGAHRTRTAR
jgi:hypothetical protein